MSRLNAFHLRERSNRIVLEEVLLGLLIPDGDRSCQTTIRNFKSIY